MMYLEEGDIAVLKAESAEVIDQAGNSVQRDRKPMPAQGSLSTTFYTKTGLARDDVPAEQARLRAVDWAAALARLEA